MNPEQLPPSPKPSAARIITSAIYALKESKDPSFYRLRRGSDLLHAMLEPVFPQLKQKLDAAGIRWVRDDNLACALLLLPHVSNDNKSLAEQLASMNYAPLRFQQLVATEEVPELFTHLQRAVQFTNGRVNPFSLVELVLGWTEQNRDARRKKLIYEYFRLGEQ